MLPHDPKFYFLKSRSINSSIIRVLLEMKCNGKRFNKKPLKFKITSENIDNLRTKSGKRKAKEYKTKMKQK